MFEMWSSDWNLRRVVWRGVGVCFSAQTRAEQCKFVYTTAASSTLFFLLHMTHRQPPHHFLATETTDNALILFACLILCHFVRNTTSKTTAAARRRFYKFCIPTHSKPSNPPGPICTHDFFSHTISCSSENSQCKLSNYNSPIGLFSSLLLFLFFVSEQLNMMS